MKANIDHKDTTIFQDQANAVVVGTKRDESFLTHHDLALGDFLSRPIKIISGTTTSTAAANYNFVNLFLGNAAVANRIKNIKHITGTFHLRFHYSTTPFYRGLERWYIVPFNGDPLCTYNINTSTTLPHVDIDASTQQVYELTVPFNWMYDWIDLSANSAYNDTGRYFATMNRVIPTPFKSVNSVTPLEVPFAVYCWMTEVQTATVIPTGIVLQSKECGEDHNASATNHSESNILQPVKSEVTNKTPVVGDTEDVLAFKNIVTKRFVLFAPTWGVSQVPNTVLWAAPVSPALISTSSFSNHCPPAAMPLACFKYWGGTMFFRFQVIVSQFERGRLRVVWSPNPLNQSSGVLTEDVSNIANSVVFDITNDKIIDVEVPWNALQPLKNFGWLDVSAGILTSGQWLGQQYDRCNGYLYLTVEQQLQSPIAADSVDIKVHFWMGEDTVASEPTCANIQHYHTTAYVAAPPSNTFGIPAELDTFTAAGTINMYPSYPDITLQSKEYTILDENIPPTFIQITAKEAYERGIISHKPSDSDAIIQLPSNLSSIKLQSAEYSQPERKPVQCLRLFDPVLNTAHWSQAKQRTHGEIYTNLRPLLKQFQPYYQGPLSISVSGTWPTDILSFPLQPVRCEIGAGGRMQFRYMNFIVWVSLFFSGRKGGIQYKVVLSGNHDPCIFTSGTGVISGGALVNPVTITAVRVRGYVAFSSWAQLTKEQRTSFYGLTSNGWSMSETGLAPSITFTIPYNTRANYITGSSEQGGIVSNQLVIRDDVLIHIQGENISQRKFMAYVAAADDMDFVTWCGSPKFYQWVPFSLETS